MTAVEWLISQILKEKGLVILDIQAALEMEKQQIMDAVEWGNRKGYDEHTLTCILDEDEDYYKLNIDGFSLRPLYTFLLTSFSITTPL
jgi:hypothetical protein